MKKFFIFFTIGFAISVAITIYGKFNHYQPIVKQQIDVTRVGESTELNLNLKKSGCYEVGFGSYDYNLLSRTSVKGGGEFEIQYLTKDNKLIDKKTVSKLYGGGAYSRTSYTNGVLDIIQIPLKGYKNIKVKLTILKLETNFNDKSQKFYFYADSSYHPCGAAFEKAKESAYANTIDFDTNETNESLKELSSALKQQDTNKIKQLIPKEFDVDVKMLINRTPLHYAAHLNDKETAEYLISLNASLDAVDMKEYTPLYYAITNDSVDVVKLLIENGADINTSKHNGHIPILFLAARDEHYEVLEYFLQSPRIDNQQKSRSSNSDLYVYVDRYTDNELRTKKIKELLEKYNVKRGEQNRTIIKGSSVQFDEPVKQPSLFEKIFKK